MAKSTKKTEDIYDTSDKYESAHNSVVKETISFDNTPFFNKILVCLYIIIALLALNLIISAIKGSSNSETNDTTKTTTTSSDNTTYDVSSFKAINTDEFIEAYNGSKTQLIYLGRATCGYCVKFLPVLKQIQANYDLQPLYLDITTVSQDDANRIIALDEDFFKGENTAYGYTPMMLIVKDGKIVDSQVGYSEYSTFEAIISKYFQKK